MGNHAQSNLPASPVPPMPSAPRPSALSTPSTMSPLFRSYASSLNSTHGATNYNTIPYGYNYVVPGAAPYFNPVRSSLESNQATVGLNASNDVATTRRIG